MKTEKQLNVDVDATVLRRMDRLRRETGQSKKFIVGQAIRQWLDANEPKEAKKKRD